MTPPVLQIDGLHVTYPSRRGVFGRAAGAVHAVRDVSLEVGAGETLGLVGESGSGKTTLGRCVLGFVAASSGSIRVTTPTGEVFDSPGRVGRTPGSYRRAVQMVFQDPLGSLNPTMSVADIVGEPVRIHEGLTGAARTSRVAELLGQVGLAVELLWRAPHELSGGQRQRVAIARALAVRPALIVLDEPVSALDVSTQSQVVNLLEQIQRDTGTAYLLVAHDLAVVRHTSDRIAVMYRGHVVETGPADAVCDAPCHPYTALLVASIPDPDPAIQRERRQHRRALTLGGGGGPVPAAGCPFAPRCAWALDRCLTERPRPLPTAAGGTVACHLHSPDRAAAPLDPTSPLTPARSTS